MLPRWLGYFPKSSCVEFTLNQHILLNAVLEKSSFIFNLQETACNRDSAYGPFIGNASPASPPVRCAVRYMALRRSSLSPRYFRRKNTTLAIRGAWSGCRREARPPAPIDTSARCAGRERFPLHFLAIWILSGSISLLTLGVALLRRWQMISCLIEVFVPVVRDESWTENDDRRRRGGRGGESKGGKDAVMSKRMDAADGRL